MTNRVEASLASLVEQLDPPELHNIDPAAFPAGIAAVVKFIDADGAVSINVSWSPSMAWTEALGLFSYAASAVSSDVVEVED